MLLDIVKTPPGVFLKRDTALGSRWEARLTAVSLGVERLHLNRIATVLAVLALYCFHGKSLSGTTISVLTVILTLWSSAELSRFAYGRRGLFGSKQHQFPAMDLVPQWLQWVSFCSFLLSCILVICSLACWRLE